VLVWTEILEFSLCAPSPSSYSARHSESHDQETRDAVASDTQQKACTVGVATRAPAHE